MKDQGDWGLDIGEQIIQRTWDGQVDKLSGILHGIQLLRDNDQKIIKGGNKICFELQNFLFKQVDHIYMQKMISGEAFREFFQSKITLEIAASNMIHTTAYSDYLIFKNLACDYPFTKMMKLQELRNQDPNYVQIEKVVQQLISIFKDDDDVLLKNIWRLTSFFLLDFIQTHYGLENFEPDKGVKFEEKMSLMSSSFQLEEELNNIYWYIKEEEINGRKLP
ncbi:hypothetical protein VP01_394g5 [Puccinia sorghi]|uniref:Uncharacterized protein n=1 Tax=Puccinia sorghi TaxID=27349 RepID=A0A0L6UUC3_9BASI|nr:hypothetical protein VP01_394g5 [Puccinia sorghi]